MMCIATSSVHCERWMDGGTSFSLCISLFCLCQFCVRTRQPTHTTDPFHVAWDTPWIRDSMPHSSWRQIWNTSNISILRRSSVGFEYRMEVLVLVHSNIGMMRICHVTSRSRDVPQGCRVSPGFPMTGWLALKFWHCKGIAPALTCFITSLIHFQSGKFTKPLCVKYHRHQYRNTVCHEF